MDDIKVYKTKDLVLQINRRFDPNILQLDDWNIFIDKLCGEREFQKDAIRDSIIYLASNNYKSINYLIEENWKNNNELRNRYPTKEEYINNLQIKDKLIANIDLATGTGKSYVIYGIAQIMLGLGFVDRVLVLCPSVTIESALIEKFEGLSGSSRLKAVIPKDAKIKNPRIINASHTIKNGDICVENIHAIYEKTGSSIHVSLDKNGERTLILNDESHHIYNKTIGKDSDSKDIKKWKEFLVSNKYNFKYILGFTGTAYIDNEYFSDCIYRYSLRQAIEDKIVKNIEYAKEDDSKQLNEKLQKIYINHQENRDKYPKIKPLTILITRDINNAINLQDQIIQFLMKKEKKQKKEIINKILLVTSSPKHKSNVVRLKVVDDKDDKTEWIVSVSMLTEGWDVKNVFQIVPWEDRAFNSKLLIAQVLGRGLRIPEQYATPQPKVTVFNHVAWSKSIKTLVDEVLELETKIESSVIETGNRAKYNFDVYNLRYDKTEVTVEHDKKRKIMDYTNIKKDGINLDSQSEIVDRSTTYETINGGAEREKNYAIEYEIFSIDEVLDKIYDEFDIRDWEGKILKLGKNEYTQNNLPPRNEIKDIIVSSMRKAGIMADLLIEKNKNRILQAFGTLLRKKGKTIVSKLSIKDPIKISTKNISKTSYSISNFRNNSALFYTSNYNDELKQKDKKIIKSLLVDNENSVRKIYNLEEINEFTFKTPLSIIVASSSPEYKFIKELLKNQNNNKMESWIKSRDSGFYTIEYSIRYGTVDSKSRKYTQKSFNPDFFIFLTKNKIQYIVVIETKSDNDDSEENKAKYKYANEHFSRLNKELEKLNVQQKYIFHFISPSSYSEFFDYLGDGRLLDGKFVSEIENILQEK